MYFFFVILLAKILSVYFNMRKLFISLAIVICSGVVHAGNYDYVTFITSNGSQQIESADLVMTVSGTNLVVTNGTSSLTLPLASLQKMYFSDIDGTYTGLNQTVFDNETAVIVSSFDGIVIGQFDNITQAVRSIPAGTYIVSQQNNSIKILVP